MKIPNSGRFPAFAMIVDLNKFTPMVTAAEAEGAAVAQYVRDCLDTLVQTAQSEEGEVVAFMGDAFLAVLPDSDKCAGACFGMAKEVDRMAEYISLAQEEDADQFGYAPGGPSVKISIEYGELNVATISSKFMGSQKLLIGSPINFAARIGAAGVGNRCLVGPAAASAGLYEYGLAGPYRIKGKQGEPEYQYYELDLGDIWRGGKLSPSDDTFWG